MATPNISTGSSIAQAVQRVTTGIRQGDFATRLVQPPNTVAGRSSIAGLRFPIDVPEPHFVLNYGAYSRRDFFSFNRIVAGQIHLPIPKQLVDNDLVTYEQQELGAAGASVQMAASGASNFKDLNMGSLASAAMTNVPELGGTLASKALGPALGGVTAQFGVAPNQFLTVLLKGPGYKKHDFSWTLSPRNATESRLIRDIVKTLKREMAVKRPTLGFFGAPAVFNPMFTRDNYLYKFKPCVLENMSVNYTPSGAPAFYAQTDAPDTVELRLSFLEIEFWFREDF